MRQKILIVEDDNADMELFKAHLKKINMSHEVIFCKKYREAVEYLKDGNTAIMFLDFNLPDNWGISTVRDTHKYFKNTPIIGMTSIANDLTINEAKKAGAKDVLIKAHMTPDIIEKRIANYAI